MVDRGKAICEQLKKNDVRYICWLPDSETHFMHPAMHDDPDLRVIQVCAEGDAIAIISGLAVAGVRGTILVEDQGLFDSGNVLKWSKGLNIPLVIMIGCIGYHRPDRKQWIEPFLNAFEVPYHVLDSDEKVGLIPQAFTEAEHRQNIVALILTNADNYNPGTAERRPEIEIAARERWHHAAGQSTTTETMKASVGGGSHD